MIIDEDGNISECSSCYSSSTSSSENDEVDDYPPPLIYSPSKTVKITKLRRLDRLIQEKINGIESIGFNKNSRVEDFSKGTTRFVDSPHELPPPPLGTTLTVILDFDETLVNVSTHANFNEWVYYIRPGAYELIETLGKLPNVEVLAWTAGMYFHAERVATILDPERRVIKHGICRSKKWYTSGVAIKNISHIPHRFTDRIILVDDSPFSSNVSKLGLVLVLPRFEIFEPHLCLQDYDRALKSVSSVIIRVANYLQRVDDYLNDKNCGDGSGNDFFEEEKGGEEYLKVSSSGNYSIIHASSEQIPQDRCGCINAALTHPLVIRARLEPSCAYNLRSSQVASSVGVFSFVIDSRK